MRSPRIDAAGERARRIHGDDPDGLFFGAIVARQAIYQRALAGARRAGDSYAIRASGVRKKLAQNFFGFALAIFDGGNGARNRAHVSRAHLLGPVFDGHSHSNVNCSRGMVSLERLEPMSAGAKS